MTSDLDSTEIRLDKAKKALSIVVRRFEDRERNLEPLNDFGNFFAALEATTTEGIHPSIAPFVSRLRTIAKNTVFMQRILCTKVRAIAAGARTSLDGENLLVLSYCTRALFEHCAAVVWLAEKVEKFSRSLENKSNPNLIECSFKRVEGLLQSLYYNKDNDTNFVHISSMLESLSRRVQDQNKVYARLCDYLHPNYGSNLLVSSGDLGAGVINPNVLWRIDEAVYLVSIAIRTIDEVAETIEELDVHVLNFVSLMDLASKPGISISKWFSVRAAKPQGDGKSKETALSFPKARTKIEAVKMFYEYLNEQGLEVIGQSVGAIEADWIFDKVDTNCGLLWFRSPMKV